MAGQVSEKLGVKSLRRMMLADSAATMSLGLHSVEAFGQSEALTTRLKHIIDDYADGPGILMELLQNADDAGASEAAFMLDNHQYGTNSVLGDALSLPTLSVHSLVEAGNEVALQMAGFKGTPNITGLLATTCTHSMTDNVFACSTSDGRMARTCASLLQ